MTQLSDSQKRVKAMRRSYGTARKQLKKAMAECRPGTAVHLQHIRALAQLDAEERAEAIALGIAPQDEGRVSKTEYHFISHVHVMPASREEAEAMVQASISKDVSKLHHTPEDEAIRVELEKEFQ